MKKQKQSTSSGFIIEGTTHFLLSESHFFFVGRRILTNGHSIAYKTNLMVKKHGSAKKFTAKVCSTTPPPPPPRHTPHQIKKDSLQMTFFLQVVAVGHDCDLAILTVEDDNFWQGLSAVQFGDVPV